MTPGPAAPPSPDHRKAVGRNRRARTRRRLIEAAILVFARRGPEHTLIDHIIREAGLSRGTFYNYFDSIETLLEACERELAVEMLMIILGASDLNASPAEKVAEALHTFLGLARRFPLFLHFNAQLGMQRVGARGMVFDMIPPVFQAGMEAGQFAPMPPDLAADIISSSLLTMFRRMHEDEEADTQAFVAAMLRMLGLPAEAAKKLANRPAIAFDVPPTSLIARAENVRRGNSPG